MTLTRTTRPAPSRSTPVSHATGFWIVAGAFLVSMAFSVVPTPLWTTYQGRDGFDTFGVTVAF
ncbi:MAG: MFS transporter, partial [Cryobacterium sp.]